jgi:hypothetical protein
MAANTYSACELLVQFGNIVLTGFGETDIVTIKRDEDRFIKKAGADGHIGRARVCHNSGTVEITLSQTAKANDQLSKLLANDESTCGTKTFSLIIKDGCGSSNYTGTDCWISGPPEVKYGKELQDRVWKIEVSDLTMFVGGNESGGAESFIDDIRSGINNVVEFVTGGSIPFI